MSTPPSVASFRQICFYARDAARGWEMRLARKVERALSSLTVVHRGSSSMSCRKRSWQAELVHPDDTFRTWTADSHSAGQGQLASCGQRQSISFTVPAKGDFMEKIGRFALMFILSLVIAGCGGGNNSGACGKATGDHACTTNAAFVGRSPMPDSPYAPRF